MAKNSNNDEVKWAHFSLSLDEELLQRIEDYRFENRYPNRNMAVNELLRLGLDEAKKMGPDTSIKYATRPNGRKKKDDGSNEE